MVDKEKDGYYMDLALAEAHKASENRDIPVGCVIVRDDVIIGSGFNCRERDSDPTGHAEIIALRDAGSRLGNWRLANCTLYVTLEPCPMCMSAIMQARIARLVYGASDETLGAAKSAFDIGLNPAFGHKIRITSGVLQDKCSNLYRDFFENLR